MTKRLRSPIGWFGGKGKMIAKILPLFPPHRIYVEPFGGGASLLMAKPSAPVEVYNDLDSGLVNLFRVLRDEAMSEIRDNESGEQDGEVIVTYSVPGKPPSEAEHLAEVYAELMDLADWIEGMPHYSTYEEAREQFDALWREMDWAMRAVSDVLDNERPA